MVRCAFILSFDRDDTVDYKEFHKKLTELPVVLNWSHYIKSSYILIANTNSALNLSKELSPLFAGKPYLLMKVDLFNVEGYLPGKAWEWIANQMDKMPVVSVLEGQKRVVRKMVAIMTRDARSFKIGKTGMPLEERLKQEDYVNTYKSIAPVVVDSSPELISMYESYLIDSFIDNPRCDNKKDGDSSEGDHMKESDSYFVYVVWN